MARACVRELGHSPGAMARGVDACLATGEVLGLGRRWEDECAPGRSDHFQSHHGIRKDTISAPQPAATIFQVPLRQSSGGAAPPAWIPPGPLLAALSSSQAVSRPGAGTPHGGQVEPRALGGTLPPLLAFRCAMGSPGGHRVNAGADGQSLWVSPLPGA